MAFSLSGSLITQSGTDTDLSGLIGIAGVSTVGEAVIKRYYILNGVNLRITGTLTLNPDYECLVFNANSPYPCLDYYSGTLTIGAKRVVGDAVRYSDGDAIIILRSSSEIWDTENQAGIRQGANGGIFNAYGGTIVSNSPISFTGDNRNRRSGTVNIEQLAFRSYGGKQCRFDNSEGQPISISGFTLDSSDELNPYVTLFSTDFDNFSAVLANCSIQSYSDQLKGLLFTDMCFAGNISSTDIRMNRGGQCLVFRDSDKGSSANVFRGNGLCQTLFAGTANLECLDASGAVAGAKYCIADTDDGNRKAAIGTTTDITYYASRMNTTGSNIYAGTTDVDGKASPIVICSVLDVVNESTFTYIDYSNYGSMSDRFDIRIISYAHNIDSRDEVLRGIGGKNIIVPLVTDILITENDQSIVSAYSTIDTTRKFYDRAKKHLYDNYNGESEVFVSRSNNELEGNGYNITLDPAAASAFAFDGTTFTIKTNEYTDALSSSGTITLYDLGSITGSINVTNTGSLVFQNHSSAIPTGSISTSAGIVIEGATDGDIFDFTNITFESTNSTIENTSGVDIVVKVSPDSVLPTLIETSGSITLDNSVQIVVSNSNLLDGTRIQLYNTTTSTEISNEVISGGAGFSETISTASDYSIGDVIRLRATYYSGATAKENYEESSTAGTSNIVFSGSQVDWEEFNALGVNPDDVTECVTDFTNVQVDVEDSDDTTTKDRIVAFLVKAETTEEGIRSWFGALNIIDSANAIWDQTVANIDVSNEKAGTTLNITDSFALVKEDGSDFVSSSTYNIVWASGLVRTATGGGLTTAQAAQLTSIDKKTKIIPALL